MEKSLSASYGSALLAAREAAAMQDYPAGTLYMVASPIGNLADISLRALHVLQRADVIACEDTRHTQTLLRAYGIERPASQWLALHQHNEAEASEKVVGWLSAGQRVAYLSDAGTPAISDPGARLAQAATASGLRVSPIPGPSSVTALLSAAGLVDDTHGNGFVFTGFLSSKATERAADVERLAGEPRAVVLLEAPHRIEALAQALSALGERRLTVGRELTKQFETITTLRTLDFPVWLSEDAHRTRGEFALVLHPLAETPAAGQTEEQRILTLLLAELPLKTAVKLTAEITGGSKNQLYDLALSLKNGER